MRIHLTERGPVGEDGQFYSYETDLDVSSEDEAYVKGREWQKLTYALSRGLTDGQVEEEEKLEEGEIEE